MKIKTFLLIAVTFVLISFSADKTKLNGTWEVVSFEVIRDGTATMIKSGDDDGSQIKTWSNQHFIFVGKFTNEDKVQHNFGGGTYNLKGNHYSEQIQYHASPLSVGKTVKMLLELKNDTLIQIFPVDENWNYDKNNCQIEKYVRLD